MYIVVCTHSAPSIAEFTGFFYKQRSAVSPKVFFVQLTVIINIAKNVSVRQRSTISEKFGNIIVVYIKQAVIRKSSCRCHISLCKIMFVYIIKVDISPVNISLWFGSWFFSCGFFCCQLFSCRLYCCRSCGSCCCFNTGCVICIFGCAHTCTKRKCESAYDS